MLLSIILNAIELECVEYTEKMLIQLNLYFVYEIYIRHLFE